MQVYQIYDNGDRPFRVEINRRSLSVFRRIESDDDGDTYEEWPCLEAGSDEIWVGRSPLTTMTEFSGGHGPEFDGNTVLFRTSNEAHFEYTHIGRSLVTFRTHSKVTEFVSLVGNSDVPYPYAVDAQGNTYLIIEDVVLRSAPNASQVWVAAGDSDPYTYYYRETSIVDSGGTAPASRPSSFQDIEAWSIGAEQYSLRYSPDAEASYDRMIPDLGSAMYLQRAGESPPGQELTRSEYVELVRRFGAAMSFEHLELVT